MPKKCPKEVQFAGAQLVKLARMMEEVEAQRRITEDAIRATHAVLKSSGAKWAMYGTALKNIGMLACGEGLVREAHNSLRLALGDMGFAEPTDDEIVALLGPEISPRGGGGGGKGGRGR
jgi:hypothetical protein